MTTPATAVRLRGAATAYLVQCFGRHTPPHVNELAALLGLSANRLTRQFRTTVGEPLSRYFRRLQMIRATDLLRDTDLPVAAVARAAGFGSLGTFHRVFRACVGVTPGEYRRN